ncbi:MAG: UPF0236 family protein [Mycoplasmataceae bacterium]|nr:UPF0236 family protein [Mycoplasmataceae bacterium]
MFEEFFGSKNYHQIVIDIVNFVQNIGHRLLTEVFKWMEEKFHKTVNKKIWHVHGIRKRLIWSPFGDIFIIRKIYKRATRWKTTKILFDSELKLQPNKYIQECFAPMFLKMVTKAKSYESISEILGCNISTSGISRLVMEQDVYLKPKKLR